jgi:hypothetical protein
MSKKIIPIVNEYGQEVAGVKTTSGDVAEFEFTIDTENRHMVCVLPPVGLELKDNKYTFVLKNGQEQQCDLSFILDRSFDHFLLP